MKNVKNAIFQIIKGLRKVSSPDWYQIYLPSVHYLQRMAKQLINPPIYGLNKSGHALLSDFYFDRRPKIERKKLKTTGTKAELILRILGFMGVAAPIGVPPNLLFAVSPQFNSVKA